MTTIAELASVYTGYHFRGRVNSKPDGQYSVIQAKDVDDSRVSTQRSWRVWTLAWMRSATFFDQGTFYSCREGSALGRWRSAVLSARRLHQVLSTLFGRIQAGFARNIWLGT